MGRDLYFFGVDTAKFSNRLHPELASKQLLDPYVGEWEEFTAPELLARIGETPAQLTPDELLILVRCLQDWGGERDRSTSYSSDELKELGLQKLFLIDITNYCNVFWECSYEHFDLTEKPGVVSSDGLYTVEKATAEPWLAYLSQLAGYFLEHDEGETHSLLADVIRTSSVVYEPAGFEAILQEQRRLQEVQGSSYSDKWSSDYFCFAITSFRRIAEAHQVIGQFDRAFVIDSL